MEWVRKNQDLTGRKRKVPVDENSEVELVSKQRHGCTAYCIDILDICTLEVDMHIGSIPKQKQLLDEARTWRPDKHIDRSQQGSWYGLSKAIWSVICVKMNVAN